MNVDPVEKMREVLESQERSVDFQEMQNDEEIYESQIKFIAMCLSFEVVVKLDFTNCKDVDQEKLYDLFRRLILVYPNELLLTHILSVNKNVLFKSIILGARARANTEYNNGTLK